MVSAGANDRCSGSNDGNAAPITTAWRQRRWRHRQHQERPQLLPRNNSRGSVNGRNDRGHGSCSNGAAAAAMLVMTASKRNDDGSHNYSTSGGSGSTTRTSSSGSSNPSNNGGGSGAARARQTPLPPPVFFSYLHLYPLYIDVGYLYSTY
jgi:hypothetical protein